MVPERKEGTKMQERRAYSVFAPSKPTPDVDGFCELGEIGSARETNWSRVTPYSLANDES